MGKIAQFLRRPIGWPTNTAVGVAFALLCWGTRLPGGDLPYIATGLLISVIVAIAWLVRLLLRLMLLGRHLPSKEQTSRTWTSWCVAPALFGIATLAIAYDLPFWTAFQISRPALDRLAQSVLADGQPRHDQWAGLFPIARTRLEPGRVEMVFDKEEFLWGSRGFYLSPDGSRIDDTHYDDQRLVEDGWYIWHYGGW